MDTRLDTDPTPPETTPQRRFAPLSEEEHDAIYPMLAPAAALAAGHEEDVFDEQILAGLVNI